MVKTSCPVSVDLPALTHPLGVWVEDDDVTGCLRCKKDLTVGWLTSGKHHCRKCGWVICSECVAPEKMFVAKTLNPKHKKSNKQGYHCVYSMF